MITLIVLGVGALVLLVAVQRIVRGLRVVLRSASR